MAKELISNVVVILVMVIQHYLSQETLLSCFQRACTLGLWEFECDLSFVIFSDYVQVFKTVLDRKMANPLNIRAE